jgi:NAD(P)-dependent dehydrogenase (short-subunit alcohol dehydrogenase family)
MGRAGHKVYATMRNPSGAPELKTIVEKESLPVTISAMDVDSDTSVSEAFEKIFSDGGDIDVLVNNAGIEKTGAVEELGLDEFRRVMETNYFGAIRCIRTVLPRMRERQSGCIINVTSIAGRLAASPFAPYTASKFALEAVSECLAQEMKAFNVRVAIVEPGIIDTSMARRIGDDPAASNYPQEQRFARLFVETLKTPASPSLVAEKILEVATGNGWQLRHPVGPDALPFLEWRNAMTDEEWAEWGALNDDDWYTRVEADFGLQIRPTT